MTPTNNRSSSLLVALAVAIGLNFALDIFFFFRHSRRQAPPPGGAPAAIADTLLGLRDKRIDELEREIKGHDSALEGLRRQDKKTAEAITYNRAKQQTIKDVNTKRRARIDSMPHDELLREFAEFRYGEN